MYGYLGPQKRLLNPEEVLSPFQTQPKVHQDGLDCRNGEKSCWKTYPLHLPNICSLEEINCG